MPETHALVHGVAVDDCEVRAIAGGEHADALPVEHPCGLSRPHLDRLGAADHLCRTVVAPLAAGERVGHGKLDR